MCEPERERWHVVPNVLKLLEKVSQVVADSVSVCDYGVCPTASVGTKDSPTCSTQKVSLHMR